MSKTSRGGHSAKDDDGEEKDYKKYMIDFEDHSMDYRTIIDMEKQQKANGDSETGVDYIIRVVRATYPGETIFKFPSLEERDTKWEKLRNKMQTLTTVFI